VSFSFDFENNRKSKKYDNFPFLLLSLGNKPITNTMAQIQKTIKEICRRPPAHWVGDGFHVFPVFAEKAFTAELSPFLMFDYAAPKSFEGTNAKKRRGVGMHPHRGFETVTVSQYYFNSSLFHNMNVIFMI